MHAHTHSHLVAGALLDEFVVDGVGLDGVDQVEHDLPVRDALVVEPGDGRLFPRGLQLRYKQEHVKATRW